MRVRLEVYSERCQISKMKFFAKLNGLQVLGLRFTLVMAALFLLVYWCGYWPCETCEKPLQMHSDRMELGHSLTSQTKYFIFDI